jgi:hypothetical protein
VRTVVTPDSSAERTPRRRQAVDVRVHVEHAGHQEIVLAIDHFIA